MTYFMERPSNIYKSKNVWHSRYQSTTGEQESSGCPSTVIRSCELEGTDCTRWTLPSGWNGAFEVCLKDAINCSLFETDFVVHSFIPDISVVPLQIHYYSEALPTTALILCHS